MDFIVLPHQLFEKKFLNKKFKYVLWEHPHYFKKYNYNKKKLILHRSSMKYYYNYLKDNGYKVTYKNFYDDYKPNDYHIYDPVDKIKLPGKYTIIETPNFLIKKSQYEKYNNEGKSYAFKPFYNFTKDELNILKNIKTQDKLNRNKMPDNIKVPDIPKLKDENNYVKNATRYIEKYFPNNVGNSNNFIFPITHKDAKIWLKDFIKKRLKQFGPYQDHIDKERDILFHSLLSPCINIGLLNPLEILKLIIKEKKNIPINSYEGYIRQLIWREYQRYCYIYLDFKDNFFNNKKKLTKSWYNGTLGIPPVDNCIKKAFDTGYLHHIERLMVVGNFMNLSEIQSKEGFKWFMEFSCDSYEWVMHQNVYDMVFFNSGGKTTRKPYSSSSNYILKMSNYKKDNWANEWDDKYHKFIEKHKKKLYKFRYHFPTLKY